MYLFHNDFKNHYVWWSGRFIIPQLNSSNELLKARKPIALFYWGQSEMDIKNRHGIMLMNSNFPYV